MLTYPDLSQPLDIFMLVLGVGFALLAGSANLMQLPFLTRTGGLLTYSKFASGLQMKGMIPSRIGMMMLYAPAMCIGVYYLLMMPQDFADSSSRADLVAVLTAIHFGKRTLECLFLHKYSGQMPITSTIFISVFYCITAAAVCHYSRLVTVYDAWTYLLGLGLFATGLAGNGYHHYLLANLRKPGEKGYKVPRGGLFEFVAAPHYLFELVGWLGLALVSQHFFNMLFLGAMTVYLTDRSIGQDEWNRKKMADYPPNRKCLVPFIF